MIEMFKEKDVNMDGVMSYEEFLGHNTKIAIAFKVKILINEVFLILNVISSLPSEASEE